MGNNKYEGQRDQDLMARMRALRKVAKESKDGNTKRAKNSEAESISGELRSRNERRAKKKKEK